MIIAFDGQSGTGKSTLSKIVANRIGFKYLNTGMLYRAVSYYLYQNNVLANDFDNIIKVLNLAQISIRFIDDNQCVFINGEDMTPFISTQEVQKTVSLYSQVYFIREKITEIQRDFAKDNNIVVEGRDIGTHVFPNANYKFFVTCDVNVRAKRRQLDLIKNGQNITLNQVIESLKNRDYLDSTREFSPLKRADDAIDIDTSNSSIEQSVDEILSYINLGA